MKRLRAALLAVVELSELVVETAFIVVAAHNIVQTWMTLTPPQQEKKPEEKRWVN